MKQHAPWIAAAVVVAAGFATISSARAQGVTKDPNLDNIAPGSITALYAGWGSGPPGTVITSLPTGLEIASSGYGSLYYAVPAVQQPVLNTADTQATLTFTLNNPAGSYYVGVPFIINDSTGAVTYGGYSTYGKGTFSETVTLSTAQANAIAAGGDVIYGFNLEFDPAGNVPGGAYDITFNSLTLSAVPEPGTMSLLGLGVVGLLAIRRKK
jgi:hypothetical protein